MLAISLPLGRLPLWFLTALHPFSLFLERIAPFLMGQHPSIHPCAWQASPDPTSLLLWAGKDPGCPFNAFHTIGTAGASGMSTCPMATHAHSLFLLN